MMNYFINFNQVVIKIIPYKLRGLAMVAWLESMLSAIQDINLQFAFFAKTVRYDLSFNGQVIYLEHILNDLFDPANRQIYITDPALTIIDNVFTFYEFEGQPQPYTYFSSEPNVLNLPYLLYSTEVQNTNEFIVKVPAAILNPIIISKIKAIVDKYKIAGKKYKIISF